MRVTAVSRVFTPEGSGYWADEVETSKKTGKFLSTIAVGARFGVGWGSTMSGAKAIARLGMERKKAPPESGAYHPDLYKIFEGS